MIIKSMSRKEATFSQLVDYFEDGRQDDKFTVYHNVYSNNPESVKAEFNKNATFLKKRKNGVYMYHEVLSITKSSILPEDQQKEILKDIALNYVKSRAKNNLVYGVLHHDKKDNLHYHFMISSNEIESDKKHRFSKEEFSQFKKDLETYVLQVYPKLEQKKLINKDQSNVKEIGEKLTNKGVELKRRTGKTAQKDSVKERLRIIFEETKDKADFFNLMERENLSLYVHGNTIGIIDRETNRKHRLTTLGLQYEFSVISDRLEEYEKNKITVDYSKNEFSKEKVSTRYLYEEQEKKYNQDSEPKPEPPKQETHYHTDKVETRKTRTEEKSTDERVKPREHKQNPKQETKNETTQDPKQTRSNESQAKPKKPEPKPNERSPEREEPKPYRNTNQNRDQSRHESKQEREIRRRKEQLKKSRESEKDNSKDYSRDR